MPRNISVALTTEAVRARIKTETRRLGWWTDRYGRRLILPGQPLTLCEKCQGRKPGEPLVRLATVEVVDVRREPLNTITEREVAAEGFPGWGRAKFVEFFCRSMRCTPDTEVTVIRWRFLDGESA